MRPAARTGACSTGSSGWCSSSTPTTATPRAWSWPGSGVPSRGRPRRRRGAARPRGPLVRARAGPGRLERRALRRGRPPVPCPGGGRGDRGARLARRARGDAATRCRRRSPRPRGPCAVRLPSPPARGAGPGRRSGLDAGTVHRRSSWRGCCSGCSTPRAATPRGPRWSARRRGAPRAALDRRRPACSGRPASPRRRRCSALAAWLAGHGALAWCAVDRVPGCRPGQLAGRAGGRSVLTHAVPPVGVVLEAEAG